MNLPRATSRSGWVCAGAPELRLLGVVPNTGLVLRGKRAAPRSPIEFDAEKPRGWARRSASNLVREADRLARRRRPNCSPAAASHGRQQSAHRCCLATNGGSGTGPDRAPADARSSSRASIRAGSLETTASTGSNSAPVDRPQRAHRSVARGPSAPAPGADHEWVPGCCLAVYQPAWCYPAYRVRSRYRAGSRRSDSVAGRARKRRPAGA